MLGSASIDVDTSDSRFRQGFYVVATINRDDKTCGHRKRKKNASNTIVTLDDGNR